MSEVKLTKVNKQYLKDTETFSKGHFCGNTNNGYFITKEQAETVLDALKSCSIGKDYYPYHDDLSILDAIAIFEGTETHTNCTCPVCCPEKYATVKEK